MENLYKITRTRLNKQYTREKGMVLVVIMLFLLIVSMLALNLFNTSLLETKMSCYYQSKTHAFYMAENYLTQYEREILAGGQVAGAKVIDSSLCGVTFYRVIASAKYNGAPSNLQSTLVKTDNTIHCDPKPNIKQGRQGFLVLE
jgi:Tfp pilus assembly protein PilX